MTFSFSFAGDDIDTSHDVETQQLPVARTLTPTQTSAFPIAGKAQLPATRHDLVQMLAAMPSKIAYSLLSVTLDDGSVMQLPRRELWDVRVQLMAEEEENAEHSVGADGSGLGTHDVKTGVYEGGFKSWESSVDLVKVLAAQGKVSAAEQLPMRIIELGCGTALPSVALLQWTIEAITSTTVITRQPTSFIVADYNPTVLQLVTLPNLILAWALHTREQTPALCNAFSLEGELELLPEVVAAFQSYLIAKRISLTFLSGAWSPEFIELVYSGIPDDATDSSAATVTLLLGAETIYSPFALQAFTEATFSILQREGAKQSTSPAVALVAAKKLYFGVGGSLDDFVDQARGRGGNVTAIREEADGVRRGVVKCIL
ncbi:Histidine methyltransferase 1 [Cordyceps militaris]|uniref:protein-histidine N-methyltransferase n=1 Tax=Cordyceps militaris TaxID=73501 RepID=A0A2H4SG54_CORMI|nr:Histidine methyltransferase 1 [Cordyceps militaris]